MVQGAPPPLLVLALLALAALVFLMYEGRHFTFQEDEWTWLLHRRGHSLGVFLRPHNEHLSVLPIIAYKIFFALFGAHSTFPFRLLDAVLACSCAILLYVLLAKRIGQWLAVAAAAVLLVLGPAWVDLVQGFQATYVASVAAGLGALVLIDRHSRRGDVAACLLLVASLGSSSVGIPILVGTSVELALRWNEDRWRRLWIAGAPALLYLIWYSHYGVSSVHLSYLHFVPLYAFHGLAAVAASLTGLTEPENGSPYDLSLEAGDSLAVLLLLGFAIQIIRGAPMQRRVWGAAAVALAFWSAAALSYLPGREANAGRYAYPVAPFVLLACAGVAAWRPNRRAQVVVGIAAVAAIASNLGFLRQGVQLFDKTSRFARAELGALEISRGVVSPAYAPETQAATHLIGVHNITPVTAGPYFSAIDAFGSQADRGAALLRAPEDAREAADFVLLHAEGIQLTPFHGSARGCTVRRPVGGQVDLTSGPGPLVLRTGAQRARNVELRRLADRFHFASVGAVAPRSAVALTLPRDRSTSPWHLRISTPEPLTLCV